MTDRELRRRLGRAAERMAEARSRRERLFLGIGLVGSLGWMIALPTVGGAFLGRYLDRRLDTQLSFTLSLLLLGLAAGAYTVWRFFLRDLTR